MSDEELSISDATLIARLRVANAYRGPDFSRPVADPIKVAAADRIEQLVATNKRLEAALRFYARRGVVSPWVDDEINEDGGDIARAVLKGDDRDL